MLGTTQVAWSIDANDKSVTRGKWKVGGRIRDHCLEQSTEHFLYSVLAALNSPRQTFVQRRNHRMWFTPEIRIFSMLALHHACNLRCLDVQNQRKKLVDPDSNNGSGESKVQSKPSSLTCTVTTTGNDWFVSSRSISMKRPSLEPKKSIRDKTHHKFAPIHQKILNNFSKAALKKEKSSFCDAGDFDDNMPINSAEDLSNSASWSSRVYEGHSDQSTTYSDQSNLGEISCDAESFFSPRDPGQSLLPDNIATKAPCVKSYSRSEPCSDLLFDELVVTKAQNLYQSLLTEYSGGMEPVASIDHRINSQIEQGRNSFESANGYRTQFDNSVLTEMGKGMSFRDFVPYQKLEAGPFDLMTNLENIGVEWKNDKREVIPNTGAQSLPALVAQQSKWLKDAF